MSAVSYFQRFSQRENHATNNTLLVLRYLYQTSPAKLENVLHEILEDLQISLGVQFEQQIRGSESIPDAHVYQNAWSIFVETKLGDGLSDEQIRRHIETIRARAAPGDTVLIALTTGAPDQAQAKHLAELARAKKVIFKWTTFAALLEAIEAQCAAHENPLNDIVTDYREYLRGESLLDVRDDWILVVPCGQTYDDNKRFNLYYAAEHSPSRKGARYLGIYKEREVSLLGDIIGVLVCSYSEGQLVHQATEFGEARPDFGNQLPEWKARIKATIEETLNYDLKTTTHRYFITDGLHETSIQKTDRGGIRAARYLHIDSLLGRKRSKEWDAANLADALKGTTFPARTE